MVIDSLLAVLLLVCLATDLKHRRIYNKVLAPGLAAALLVNAWQGGWEGFAGSALGFLAGFVVLLIPYLMGGMGGGDVKLLAVVGAFKGAVFVWNAAVYMALLGGVFAMAAILMRAEARTMLRWTASYAACLMQGVRLPISLRGEGMLSGTFPYGAAIAGGAALCYGFGTFLL